MMDDLDLQWRLVYSIFVANKTAEFADNKTLDFIGICDPEYLPFDYIKVLGDSLERILREVGCGQYRRTVPAIKGIVDLDLRTCTVDDLEAIHGIGMKTSRFYLMWIGRGDDIAALDVHVLRWLKGLGYNVPKNTPSSKKQYRKIEKWFLHEARKRNMTPRELDWAVWDAGKRKEKSQEK